MLSFHNKQHPGRRVDGNPGLFKISRIAGDDRAGMNRRRFVQNSIPEILKPGGRRGTQNLVVDGSDLTCGVNSSSPDKDVPVC